MQGASLPFYLAVATSDLTRDGLIMGLAHISRRIVFTFIVAIGCILLINLTTLIYIHKVKQNWQQRESVVGKKVVYLSRLRDALGYGGLIHNFKNLVLRKDTTKISQVYQNQREIEDAVSHIRILGASDQEQALLNRCEPGRGRRPRASSPQ